MDARGTIFKGATGMAFSNSRKLGMITS